MRASKRAEQMSMRRAVRRVLDAATEPLSSREIAVLVLGRAPDPGEWFCCAGVVDYICASGELMALLRHGTRVYVSTSLYDLLDALGRIGPQRSDTLPLSQTVAEHIEHGEQVTRVTPRHL